MFIDVTSTFEKFLLWLVDALAEVLRKLIQDWTENIEPWW